MENCIFCKIANGEIPAATLYEDENFRVILDLGPASKGHALILPKSHAANIYELSDEMAAKAMILAKKMATAMTAALKCDGFNIVQNNGECAGRVVYKADGEELGSVAILYGADVARAGMWDLFGCTMKQYFLGTA